MGVYYYILFEKNNKKYAIYIGKNLNFEMFKEIIDYINALSTVLDHWGEGDDRIIDDDVKSKVFEEYGRLIHSFQREVMIDMIINITGGELVSEYDLPEGEDVIILD